MTARKPGRRRPVRDGLTRADIDEARIRALAEEHGGERFFPILDSAVREQSRVRTLAQRPLDGGLWIFGYGSLMWNPALEVAESRSGLVHGYHRQFCLWTPIGRGTPDCPGLMLALESGGACRGMAMRIAPERIEEESRIVWLREMLSGAYRPVWVRVRTAAGPLDAVTFAIDRTHRQYAGRVPEPEMIRALATAEGRLGRARDYLHNLVLHLDELGIADGPMHRLYDKVESYAAAADG